MLLGKSLTFPVVWTPVVSPVGVPSRDQWEDEPKGFSSYLFRYWGEKQSPQGDLLESFISLWSLGEAIGRLTSWSQCRDQP